MTALDRWLDTATTAATVAAHTGSAQHGGKAAGYAAFVQTVTGQSPKTELLPGGRVKMVLSDSQVSSLQNFLDEQISGMLEKKEPSVVDYGLQPVLAPWSAKYAAPAGIGVLLAGVLVGKLF